MLTWSFLWLLTCIQPVKLQGCLVQFWAQPVIFECLKKSTFHDPLEKKSWQRLQIKFKLYYSAVIPLTKISFQSHFKVHQGTTCILFPWARFSKSRNLSGDMILFVSSKRRRLETRNFAVILIFNPFATYEKTASQNERVAVLRMAFRARNVFGTFKKRAPCLSDTV